MRYHRHEVQDRLAAEYVLGTLHGRARARFERLVRELPALREHVHLWEQRLSSMVTELPPQRPPKRVWRSVQQRIRPTRGAERRGLGWPLAAVAGIAAATALAIHVLLTPPPVAPQTDAVAVVAESAEAPLWTVSADRASAELRITAVGDIRRRPDQSFELWLLPPTSGDAPASLGVLPQSGSLSRPLPEGLVAAAPAGLAVSVEPEGGSPTGQPTGEIVYQSRLVRVNQRP